MHLRSRFFGVFRMHGGGGIRYGALLPDLEFTSPNVAGAQTM
jgi:hypothetical protein